MRQTAQGHDLAHRHRPTEPGALEQGRDATGALVAADIRDAAPVEGDAALRRRDEG
jgi:hypothetical protein